LYLELNSFAKFIPSKDALTTSGLAETSSKVAPAKEYMKEIFFTSSLSSFPAPQITLKHLFSIYFFFRFSYLSFISF